MIEKGLESRNAKAFQQLLYIDDFMKFKGMMLKRNAQLKNETLSEMKNPSNKSILFEQQNLPQPSKEISEEEMLKKVM